MVLKYSIKESMVLKYSIKLSMVLKYSIKESMVLKYSIKESMVLKYSIKESIVLKYTKNNKKPPRGKHSKPHKKTNQSTLPSPQKILQKRRKNTPNCLPSSQFKF